MMLFTGTTDKREYNKPVYGNLGAYTLSDGVKLPYFSCTMDVDRVVKELKVAQEFPPSLDNSWGLTELYQREIDDVRVQDDMVKGYLSDPNKLKFFNAITVVLLPKSRDGKILENFDSVETFDPPVPFDGQDSIDSAWNNESVTKAIFGGVQYLTYGDQARLRWDEEIVHAVVVDGQHRLSALRQYKKVLGNVFSNHAKNTKIPVIFVLLSAEAGFSTTNEYQKKSIRSIAREIFTDLNKNAKEVDRARELILDDWSINARCLRTLLTEEAARDSDSSIPLSLVRWQDSNIRFDSGYYLNTLVHLDQIVSSVLNIKYPQDPLDKDDVLAFLSSIEASLGQLDGNKRKLKNSAGCSLTDFYKNEYLDENDDACIPLKRLPVSYLDAAIAGFEKNHKSYLYKILTELRPYKKILKYSRDNDLIEGVFGRFFSQTSQHQALIRDKYNSQQEDWYSSNILKHIGEIESIKKEGDVQSWAFKAIFQKAAVKVVNLIEFELKGHGDNIGDVDDFISYLNKLYDIKILTVEHPPMDGLGHPFWAFIATNPGDGKIRVNKTSEKNIYAILLLGYYLFRMKTLNENEEWKSIKKIIMSNVSSVQWPSCYDAFQTLCEAYNKADFFGRERHRELAKESKQKEAKEYALKLLSKLYDVI